MSSAKKRKIADEKRVFQEEWTDMFFFIKKKEKPFCLKCKRELAVMKKENLKRHYETNHSELKKLGWGTQKNEDKRTQERFACSAKCHDFLLQHK